METIFIMPKIYTFMIVFVITATLSLIIALNMFSIRDILPGIIYLIRYALYTTLIMIAYQIRKENKMSFDLLMSYMISIGLVIAGLGIIQLLFIPDFTQLTLFGFDPHQSRLASTFLDPNFCGAYLILTLSLVIYRYVNKRQKVDILLTVFLVTAIILTFSRSAYLMLLIFCFLIGILKWRRMLVITLVGLALLLLLVPRAYQRVSSGLTLDKTAQERIVSWNKALTIYKTSPIFGVGFNNYRLAQDKLNLFRSTTIDGGHSGAGTDSSFLLVFVTSGIGGALAFLLFWVMFLKQLLKKKDNLSIILLAVFCSLLIESQFVNSLFYTPIMIWCFVIMGFVI